LTFIEGEMAGRPLSAWAATERVVERIARLQRRLHDCARGFVLPPGIAWAQPLEIAGVPRLFEVAELIGHNDLTPENVLFVDEKPVGLIDFDLAGPTTRLLDVVNGMLWWAPLRDPADRDPLLRDVDAGRRMRVYADAYGLELSERERVIDLAARRFRRSWHVMKHRAEHDGGGWARMWSEGVGDVIRRSSAWLEREGAHLHAALLAGA
jgi:Ser/Thr protein kinase RdoA (MazF antagonist)